MPGNPPEPARAPRRDRTPRPVLFALLRTCSFRLENDAAASRFRWELGSVASLLPPAPTPLLRNRFVFLANIPPKRPATQNVVPTPKPLMKPSKLPKRVH
jgi:hypothetical protein